MNNDKTTYNSIVRIPSVDKDSRIGSVFNDIFSILFQTEQTDTTSEHDVVWDFSDCSFLHPFFIGAAAILKRRYNNKVRVSGCRRKVAGYLEAVHFNSPLVISPIHNKDDKWIVYKNKSYLPICLFNPADSSSVKAQELIQDALRSSLGFTPALNSVISLLFAELIDNITEHSKSSEGYLFCQTMPSINSMCIMIADTGRSIYSSYAADDRYNQQLSDLESSGLIMALSGKSTKDRPETENRGYGISKSRKLVVEGLGGEFFILSGCAFARHDINGETIADLPENFRWDGTAVLVKIPLTIPDNFNIYNFIS